MQNSSNKNNTSNMSTNNNSNNNQRICENTMCRTTRTPLWRKGWIAERGRKVRLCNACGLHFRKGHFCRYCNQVYRDTCEAEMIQEGWIMCRRCERWVHKKCAKNNHESLSTAGAPSDEEQQQSPSISTEFSSFSNTSYQCSDCTTSIRTSRAQSAPLSLPHSLSRQITSDSAATVSPIPLKPTAQHQPHHDNRTALHEPHEIQCVSSLRDAQSYHHPPQQQLQQQREVSHWGSTSTNSFIPSANNSSSSSGFKDLDSFSNHNNGSPYKDNHAQHNRFYPTTQSLHGPSSSSHSPSISHSPRQYNNYGSHPYSYYQHQDGLSHNGGGGERQSSPRGQHSSNFHPYLHPQQHHQQLAHVYPKPGGYNQEMATSTNRKKSPPGMVHQPSLLGKRSNHFGPDIHPSYSPESRAYHQHSNSVNSYRTETEDFSPSSPLKKLKLNEGFNVSATPSERQLHPQVNEAQVPPFGFIAQHQRIQQQTMQPLEHRTILPPISELFTEPLKRHSL